MTPADPPDPRPAQRELAGRQVVAKVLADEVKTLSEQTRATLEPLLDAREAVSATLPDGTVIGQVSRSKGRRSARVVDDAALVAWVAEHRPDEIVQTVRSSFVEVLKTQAKAHGHAFDVQTGEVIPGIEIVEGSSAFTVRPDEEARHLVMTRLAELLADGLMPSLPAPTGEKGAAA